jgi:MoxR-like ATPase
MKGKLEYPAAHEEREILDRSSGGPSPRECVVDAAQVCAARTLVEEIHVSERIKDYMITLVEATRTPSHYGLKLDRYLHHGVSPRGTIDLERATKVVALLRGGAFAQVGDVQAVWADVVGHRLGLSGLAAEEGLDGQDIAAALLAGMPAP